MNINHSFLSYEMLLAKYITIMDFQEFLRGCLKTMFVLLALSLQKTQIGLYSFIKPPRINSSGKYH